MSLLLEQTRTIRNSWCACGIPLAVCAYHLCEFLMNLRIAAMEDGFDEAVGLAEHYTLTSADKSERLTSAAALAEKLKQAATNEKGSTHWGCGLEYISKELEDLQLSVPAIIGITQHASQSEPESTQSWQIPRKE